MIPVAPRFNRKSHRPNRRRSRRRLRPRRGLRSCFWFLGRCHPRRRSRLCHCPCSLCRGVRRMRFLSSCCDFRHHRRLPRHRRRSRPCHCPCSLFCGVRRIRFLSSRWDFRHHRRLPRHRRRPLGRWSPIPRCFGVRRHRRLPRHRRRRLGSCSPCRRCLASAVIPSFVGASPSWRFPPSALIPWPSLLSPPPYFFRAVVFFLPIDVPFCFGHFAFVAVFVVIAVCATIFDVRAFLYFPVVVLFSLMAPPRLRCRLTSAAISSGISLCEPSAPISRGVLNPAGFVACHRRVSSSATPISA